MFDEIHQMRNNPHLLQLLNHYATLGKEAWHNRLMHLDGIETSELVKMHGELIAFSWADQDAGQVPCCYRVTSSGLRPSSRSTVAWAMTTKCRKCLKSHSPSLPRRSGRKMKQGRWP